MQAEIDFSTSETRPQTLAISEVEPETETVSTGGSAGVEDEDLEDDDFDEEEDDEEDVVDEAGFEDEAEEDCSAFFLASASSIMSKKPPPLISGMVEDTVETGAEELSLPASISLTPSPRRSPSGTELEDADAVDDVVDEEVVGSGV